MRVTALLVCHNGARWLPAVVAGLRDSTERPDRVVVVDTGSRDDSVAIVEGGLGVSVVAAPVGTGYADAVRAGLAACPAQHPENPDDPDEWVWLLHDDASPAPDCLQRLRDAAAVAPEEVAVLGPKLREWPSLKRLLEVGVTISGTGKRETGLEPGEYDQGQHDDAGPVLAVNTAGMLVRRRVLEDLGLDPALPLFGNDIDFGWRVARAGAQTRIVPDAVMFHVEAAHRGVRRSTLAARPRRDERAGAIYTLLVNGAAAALPWRMLRLFLGGMLRAGGFLLVRAIPEAIDEMAALGRVYSRPFRVLAGRRWRRRQAVVGRSAVRPLLAPAWMPYRHGLDFLVDLARALFDTFRASLGGDGAGQHRNLATRLLRSVDAWAVAVAVVVALVASRGLLTGASLHGGALLPAPSIGHWWHTWAESWHWLGAGSSVAGPAYLFPLALAGSILFGQPGWVVWLLFVLTVPLTLVGALRFLRRLTSGRWAALWGAASYALLPVLSGAVGQGRLGTVVGLLVLPWVATAALGLASADPDRRWRATWRTALGTALLAAFVPLAMVAAWALLAVHRHLGAHRMRWQQLLVLAAFPLVLLLPWLVDLLAHPGAVLVEAGRPASVAVRPDVWQVLAGNSGGPGAAPYWFTLGLPFAGLVALVRPATRTRVLRCWSVVLVAALLLTLVSRVSVDLPGVPEPFRPWPGFWLLLVTAALVTAAVVAADGAVSAAREASFGWRQLAAALALVGGVLAPAAGTAWWLWSGTGGPLQRSNVERLPEYLALLAESRHDGATLYLTGGARPGERAIEYRVLRTSTDWLGDDAVRALTPPSRTLTSLVGELVTQRASDAAPGLAAHGISYVYAPAPVNSQLSGSLDASNGFESASAPARGARAWRVAPEPGLSAVPVEHDWWHSWLIGVQVAGVAAGIVLAAPSRRHG